MIQPVLQKSKENIYHNQNFSFTGRTEKIVQVQAATTVVWGI